MVRVSGWGWHLPSEEELRKARSEERADGWGFVDGMLESDWLSKDCLIPDPAKEVTRLESGQILYHHTRDQCSSDCCLHGTSSYASCKLPRSWRCDRSILEHLCPHGFGHPCTAGMAHALKKPGAEGKCFGLEDTHDCDGCCKTIDELTAPATVEQVDDRADHLEDRLMKVEYGQLLDDSDLEILSGWLIEFDDEMEQVKRRITRLAWLGFFIILGIGALYFVK